jgi:hypothetical protein
MSPAAATLRTRFRPLVVAATRAFLITWLAMIVGGIVLSVIAGHWMSDVDPVPRTLLQVFFAGQFVVVGFYIALRRALAAGLVRGAKSLQLGRLGLGFLLNRFHRQAPIEAPENSLAGDANQPRRDPFGTLPAILAQQRIGSIVSALSAGRRSRRGVFGWLRGALMSAVGAIAWNKMRGRSQRAERVNVSSMREELEDQIDDLLLARLRYTLWVWTAMIVAGLVLEVVAISWIANRLAG